ncbi:MAG TPA: DUF983 domain-containing protein [Chitinophagaceae bacterium]|nr:DUF983 domain-containing protein [Chitinophagaceae bacterium]
MTDTVKRPGYLLTVLSNKCPRCREGHIYETKSSYNLKSIVKMKPKCPVCGQPTEIEVGFYYGTAYVSYAISVAVCVASFIAWWVIIGVSLEDNRFFWWLGSNAVLLVVIQPPLMRLSRTLWLSWFVSYDPDWRNHPLDDKVSERIVPEQMGNW